MDKETEDMFKAIEEKNRELNEATDYYSVVKLMGEINDLKKQAGLSLN